MFETELTFGSYDQVGVTVAIEFEFDGLDINVTDVKVTKYSASCGDMDRQALAKVGGDGSWLEMLDEIAKRDCQRVVDEGGWLYLELMENDPQMRECDNFGEGIDCDCPACERLQNLLEEDFES